MSIPDSFLEELVARSDLVEIASSYVSLKRRGGRYWACCPFHSEKTPSFCISPEKQQYYCFGCHKGGGVISFVMEIENLPFRDAVQLLADRAGMTVPEEENKGQGSSKKRQRLLDLNREAARYYHQQLLQPQNKYMLDYLTGRGLSRRTITNFGLGAAPAGWDNLIRAMAEKGYDKLDLLEVGLAVKSEKGHIYDRFRDRVMFPIIDLKGNVIAFGGRVLDDSTPKYLNSPDSPVFNKRKNLFALNIARKTKQGRIILTEGYMDTIALHQAGFDCAVASLGTSLTEDQAQLIKRYTGEVVISYDGDAPGIKASQRAIGILEKTGLKVRVLQVSGGVKDPDEYVKAYGPQAFQRLIDQSGNHIEYQLQKLGEKYDLKKDDQKVQYLQEAAAVVADISSPVEREIYGNRAAEAAGISSTAMSQEVERVRTQKSRRDRKREQRASLNPVNELQPEDRELRYKNIRSARAEEEVIRLVVKEPDLFQMADDRLKPEEFSSEYLGRIYSLLRDRWRQGRDLNPNLLAGELNSEEMNQLMTLLQKPVTLANGEQAMDDCINTIHTEQLKRAGSDSDEALMAFRNKKLTEERTYE